MPTIAYPEKYKLGSVLLPAGVRSLLSHQFHRMRRTWDFYQRESGLPSYSPRGDFNSPLPDIFEGQRVATAASNKPTDKSPGYRFTN